MNEAKKDFPSLQSYTYVAADKLFKPGSAGEVKNLKNVRVLLCQISG